MATNQSIGPRLVCRNPKVTGGGLRRNCFRTPGQDFVGNPLARSPGPFSSKVETMRDDILFNHTMESLIPISPAARRFRRSHF